MRDLAVVQVAQRFPHAHNGNRLGALADRRSAGGGVRVQRPAAVERGDADRRRVGDAELTDGDGHQRAMLDGAAHGGVQRRGLAVAQPHLAPELAQRAAAALVRAVHLHHGRRLLVLTGWPAAPAARHRTAAPPSARTRAPAPGHRPNGAVERHLEARACRRRARPTRRRTSRPPDPSSERAGTTALMTRWMGTNASSSAHHQRRHRAGSQGPETVSTAASIAIQRGSSTNCEASVSSALGQVEMPLRRRDAGAGDRQRQPGDRGRGRVGAEQFPLPGDDQADQDHERQRQDRDAVDQVHQIGLGRGQDGDDLGDGLLEGDPLVAGDQRAGDDDARGTARPARRG